MGSGDLNNFSVRESSITWGVWMQHEFKVDEEALTGQAQQREIQMKQLLPVLLAFFYFSLVLFIFHFFFVSSFFIRFVSLVRLGWCLALIIRPVGSPPQNEFRL